MHTDKIGERWCEPELYQLKGALLLQPSPDNQAEAENCSITPSALPKASKQNPGNCVQQPVSLGSGSSKEDVRKPITCWHQSTTGLQKGSTQLTSKTPRHCWMNYHNSSACALQDEYYQHRIMGVHV
jgi:hypothetical protein